jgi:hypothetical protein
MGPRGDPEAFGYKNILRLQEIEPKFLGRPARSLLTVPTIPYETNAILNFMDYLKAFQSEDW